MDLLSGSFKPVLVDTIVGRIILSHVYNTSSILLSRLCSPVRAMINKLLWRIAAFLQWLFLRAFRKSKATAQAKQKEQYDRKHHKPEVFYRKIF